MESNQPPQLGTAEKPRGNRRRAVLMGIALAAATLVAFGPILRNGFVNYDDGDYVTTNPEVLSGLSWAGVKWAFTAGHAGNWHPLTWLSHQLDVQLFKLQAWGHHLTSLLLHAANAVLLFLVLRRATRSAAGGMSPAARDWLCAGVAGLFALHPLRVESVAWVAERKDVLSGFFFMLTLGAYVRYAERRREQEGAGRETGGGRRGGFSALGCYLFALGFFALGLMSKPMLVTVPLVLLLLDYWPLERWREREGGGAASAPGGGSPVSLAAPVLTRLLWEKVPFAVLSAASCVVTFLVQRKAGAVHSLETIPLEFRITNALISYVRYAGKLVWPAKLAVFYPAPAEWPPLWVALAALGLVGVSVLVVRAARRAPWLAFGWFWYGVMLIPVIGLVQVGQQAMADRYTYLPLIGLCVAGVWSGAELVRRRARAAVALAAAGAVALLAAAGALTWRQAGFWRDSTSLFEHALAVTRENFVAHNNLGVVLLDADQQAAALRHFTEAVRIKSNYPEGLGNLALCRLKEGRTDEAEELLRRSLQKRETVETWHNLGRMEEQRGRAAEAEQAYTKALRLRPNHAPSLMALGILLSGQHREEEALRYLQAAVRAAPENADARFNLAFALNNRGEFAGAAAQYAEVCRLHPEDVEARQNLALALLGANQPAAAAAQFRRALELRPAAHLHHYLALVLDSQGQAAEALAHYRDAARLGPNTVLYLNDLAWFLATTARPDLRDGAEAVRLAERARELNGGREARIWGTLDAAYAEAGRFDEALKAAARARELAQAAGQADIARQAEERMALYQRGQPYHMPPP